MKPVYFFHTTDPEVVHPVDEQNEGPVRAIKGADFADHVRGRDTLQQVKSFNYSGWSDGE